MTLLDVLYSEVTPCDPHLITVQACTFINDSIFHSYCTFIKFALVQKHYNEVILVDVIVYYISYLGVFNSELL